VLIFKAQKNLGLNGWHDWQSNQVSQRTQRTRCSQYTAHLTTTPAPEEKCTRWVRFTHLGHENGLSHQNRAPRLELDPFAQTVLRNSAPFFSLQHHGEGHTQARTRSLGNSEQSARDLYQKIRPHRKAGTAFALDQSSITLNLKDVMRPLNRRSRTLIYSGVNK
jgi:hypothetical protein